MKAGEITHGQPCRSSAQVQYYVLCKHTSQFNQKITTGPVQPIPFEENQDQGYEFVRRSYMKSVHALVVCSDFTVQQIKEEKWQQEQ